jgi:hypothetical protein
METNEYITSYEDTKQLSSYWNKRHFDQDIYIIGSSRQLLNIGNNENHLLKSKTVVGGNRVFYKVPLTYMISSYIPDIVLATLYLKKNRIIKLNNAKETMTKPQVPFVHNIQKSIFNPTTGLTTELSASNATLITQMNQVLAMSHLALIMGAKRIIYIGVDQTDHSYFFQHDKEIGNLLRRDLHKLQSYYLKKYTLMQHTSILKILFSHVNNVNMNSTKFYYDFSELFSVYFYEMGKNNIEVISTLKNSVVHRAGAKFVDLDKIL